MDRERDRIAIWIAREILPHEGSVRRWLVRSLNNGIDADDVIQEAYCRIAKLGKVDHIDNPGGYLRRTVQAVVVDMMRQAKTKNFGSMTEIEWSNVMDHEPLADRALEARQELGRVNGLLAGLSETCRKAIVLRRVEGLSQRETAQRLGVSESVVRNHLVRGLKKVLNSIAERDEAVDGEQESDKNKVTVIGKRGSL
jgi:RNA polymerase sigma-70 factor (ECF subfamily)